jgi:uncharacterized membrane protein
MTAPEHDRFESARRALPRESVALAVMLLTLLALILRLYRIGAQSLWVDELLTINQGNQPGHSLWEQFLDDVQSPLPMVLVAWLRRSSPAEAWLRLPGAVLGAFSVPLLYEVGRRLHGARTGLFAALLLAIHPFHIWHAQEVRGYAYLLFFGLAAIVVALSAGERLARGRAVAFALLGSAAALCNLQGLFWMGGFALGLLAAGRIRRRDAVRWTLAFTLLLAITLPWWSASLRIHESKRLLPGQETGEPLRGKTTMTAWAIPYAGYVLAVGTTLGPSPRELQEAAGRDPAAGLSLPRRHLPLVLAVSALAATLAVAGLSALRRRAVEPLLWAAVPVAIALLLALRNIKPFNPRYTIAALPTLLLVMGAGFQRLPRRSALLLMVGWLAVSGVALARYYFVPDYQREDVRAAARLVEAREGREDLVLAPTIGHVFLYYYRGSSPVRVYLPAGWPSPPSVADVVEDRTAEKRYLWYVRARAWVDDPHGELRATLDRRFPRVGVFRLPGVEVLLYDRRPQG